MVPHSCRKLLNSFGWVIPRLSKRINPYVETWPFDWCPPAFCNKLVKTLGLILIIFQLSLFCKVNVPMGYLHDEFFLNKILFIFQLSLFCKVNVPRAPTRRNFFNKILFFFCSTFHLVRRFKKKCFWSEFSFVNKTS